MPKALDISSATARVSPELLKALAILSDTTVRRSATAVDRYILRSIYINISHNFFADNLKLYAGTTNNLKKLLDIVTTFSKNNDMKFGIDTCAYIKINAGKQTNSKVPLEMNNLTNQPVTNGDTYKYLGQDENIAYIGEVNKKRVQKELYARCRKVWSSELSAYNKATPHNIFIISIITPTFGIIDWTIEELKEIDKRTRKILRMNGSFHPNRAILIDSIYHDTKVGGD